MKRHLESWDSSVHLVLRRRVEFVTGCRTQAPPVLGWPAKDTLLGHGSREPGRTESSGYICHTRRWAADLDQLQADADSARIRPSQYVGTCSTRNRRTSDPEWTPHRTQGPAPRGTLDPRASVRARLPSTPLQVQRTTVRRNSVPQQGDTTRTIKRFNNLVFRKPFTIIYQN